MFSRAADKAARGIENAGRDAVNGKK